MTDIVPGRLYRDLDGTLVRLVSVEDDICTWAPLQTGQAQCQFTHIDNFRKRFRPFANSTQGRDRDTAA